jgi:hypothetical protein
MRPAGIVLAFLLLGGALAQTVAAHPTGSGIIRASGTILLTPAGTPNATFHGYLRDLGIPPGPGDELRFSWSANAGLGPAVFFEIHSHPDDGYERYYKITAARCDASWSVPGEGDFMVLWTNPDAAEANVSYVFQLLPPPPDLSILALFAIVPVVAIAWVVWSRRRDAQRPK